MIALKALLIFFLSKKQNVMLIGVVLIDKVNWKRKTCSVNCHFFKQSEFDSSDYLAHILLFFNIICSCSDPPYIY